MTLMRYNVRGTCNNVIITNLTKFVCHRGRLFVYCSTDEIVKASNKQQEKLHQPVSVECY